MRKNYVISILSVWRDRWREFAGLESGLKNVKDGRLERELGGLTFDVVENSVQEKEKEFP